jgi:hypothetical protein
VGGFPAAARFSNTGKPAVATPFTEQPGHNADMHSHEDGRERKPKNIKPHFRPRLFYKKNDTV